MRGRPKLMTPRAAAWAIIAALAALIAAPTRAEAIHASPHLEHTSWLLGAKVVQFNGWTPSHGEEPHETQHGIGGGIIVERTVIEGWLEIELSAAAVAVDGDTVVPLDVLFKKSFEFGRFNPYVAVGPSISIEIADGHSEAAAGGAFAAGAYYWFSDHWGVDFDADYALVSKHGVAQELALSIGPVVRF